MTIDERQEEVIEEFGRFTEWIERYEHIINIGSTQPTLDEKERVPENLIRGCQSKVWIVRSVDSEGCVTFRAHSDTLIINGIVALILRVVNGMRQEEIAGTDFYFISRIGLSEHLSETRSNGIRSVIEWVVRGE